MRMIDADALFTNLDGMMAVRPTGYIHGETVADMISDASTVDAIPVEWIQRKIDMLEQNMYSDLPKPAMLAQFIELINLKRLVTDWEAENE